jgi:hypothetical protein
VHLSSLASFVSHRPEFEGSSPRDNLIRNEAETQLLLRQGGHVSTIRVFLADDRYITIRAPLHFACSLQAVLGFA